MASERRCLRMIIDGVDHTDESTDGVKRNIYGVLARIHDYYKKALDRLPAELIPSLLDAGFCFGFLDPVSNIIANTVSQERDKNKRKRSRAFAPSPTAVPVAPKKKGSSSRAFATSPTAVAVAPKKKGMISKIESQRLRDMAISKIITESSSEHGIFLPGRNSSVASRSLLGLVTFLTSYFRYLTVRDALRYLRLSKADLLVAVRLVELDHARPHFLTIDDPTAKIALGCAAISVVHPRAATFVSRSFSLASQLDEVSNLLAAKDRVFHSTAKRLSELSTKGMAESVDPRKPMKHAISRMQHHSRTKIVPAGLQKSLKRVLLDKIHVIYLKAISRMPKHDLCSRHHRGLLKAGHCYGPSDPVTNIILNTIWYDTTFPTKQEFEVKLICTKSLARIECLSLYGLVAFTRIAFPVFSEYEAMEYLLINNAKLDRVPMMAQREGHAPFSESDAYNTAARAAHHPCPTALVEFAMTVMPELGETLRSMLKGKLMLSSSDVRTISETLSQKFPPSKSLKLVAKLRTHVFEIIPANCEKFDYCQSVIVERVEAALLRYAQQGGQEYELHVICDVNADIPDDGRYDYVMHDTRFSHINIWARRKGSQYADEVPTLLFIECSNNIEDMQDMRFLCRPILESSKDAGRCFHCEEEGTRIIHPPSEVYLGRCTEFEDMASGKHPMSNEDLVNRGKYNTFLAESNDSIYFDPAWENEGAIRRAQEWMEQPDPLSCLKDKMRQDLALALQKYKIKYKI